MIRIIIYTRPQRYFLLALLSCWCAIVHAQKNDKNYNDGYIIRFGDTINCKIYTGHQENEIGFELRFKYDDGRIIKYHPGSVVKGFGYKDGSKMRHFYTIDVPEYWINEQKNNKGYAEIISDGQLRLYKFIQIKNSVVTIPIVVPPVVVIVNSSKNRYSYFIKTGDTDSLVQTGHSDPMGPTYFKREEIIPFLKGYMQAIANVSRDHYMYEDELAKVFARYNTWHAWKKTQQQPETQNE